ncbi:MAG: NAD-dependent epimerase/dehydratase family protein [Ruminococcus sp.]|nr:NAD-dependent epimerase/dehydratase family protein [Ruminococcus sp.]
MKLLVTGGTVFASRYTAEYFRDRGHDVYTLNRGSRPQPEGVTLIKGDRHDCRELLRAHSFDAVLDITAYNAEDVNGLLDGLGDFGSYILISSSAVYPETAPQPFSESEECGPNIIWGSYGTDKIAAEKALHERVPEAYILRPPYLCGRMNNLYREAFVFECAEKGLPFYVPEDGTLPLQFFDIGDMCRFMEILLEKKPEQRIYNVGNSSTVTAEEWVLECYSVLGKVPEIKYVKADFPQRSYFPFHPYAYRLDVSAMEALMPETLPFREGLVSSYEWYKDHRDCIVRKPLLDYIENNLR